MLRKERLKKLFTPTLSDHQLVLNYQHLNANVFHASGGNLSFATSDPGKVLAYAASNLMINNDDKNSAFAHAAERKNPEGMFQTGKQLLRGWTVILRVGNYFVEEVRRKGMREGIDYLYEAAMVSDYKGTVISELRPIASNAGYDSEKENAIYAKIALSHICYLQGKSQEAVETLAPLYSQEYKLSEEDQQWRDEVLGLFASQYRVCLPDVGYQFYLHAKQNRHDRFWDMALYQDPTALWEIANNKLVKDCKTPEAHNQNALGAAICCHLALQTLPKMQNQVHKNDLEEKLLATLQKIETAKETQAGQVASLILCHYFKWDMSNPKIYSRLAQAALVSEEKIKVYEMPCSMKENLEVLPIEGRFELDLRKLSVPLSQPNFQSYRQGVYLLHGKNRAKNRYQAVQEFKKGAHEIRKLSPTDAAMCELAAAEHCLNIYRDDKASDYLQQAYQHFFSVYSTNGLSIRIKAAEAYCELLPAVQEHKEFHQDYFDRLLDSFLRELKDPQVLAVVEKTVFKFLEDRAQKNSGYLEKVCEKVSELAVAKNQEAIRVVCKLRAMVQQSRSWEEKTVVAEQKKPKYIKTLKEAYAQTLARLYLDSSIQNKREVAETFFNFMNDNIKESWVYTILYRVVVENKYAFVDEIERNIQFIPPIIKLNILKYRAAQKYDSESKQIHFRRLAYQSALEIKHRDTESLKVEFIKSITEKMYLMDEKANDEEKAINRTLNSLVARNDLLAMVRVAGFCAPDGGKIRDTANLLQRTLQQMLVQNKFELLPEVLKTAQLLFNNKAPHLYKELIATVENFDVSRIISGTLLEDVATFAMQNHFMDLAKRCYLQILRQPILSITTMLKTLDGLPKALADDKEILDIKSKLVKLKSDKTIKSQYKDFVVLDEDKDYLKRIKEREEIESERKAFFPDEAFLDRYSQSNHLLALEFQLNKEFGLRLNEYLDKNYPIKVCESILKVTQDTAWASYQDQIPEQAVLAIKEKAIQYLTQMLSNKEHHDRVLCILQTYEGSKPSPKKAEPPLAQPAPLTQAVPSAPLAEAPQATQASAPVLVQSLADQKQELLPPVDVPQPQVDVSHVAPPSYADAVKDEKPMPSANNGSTLFNPGNPVNLAKGFAEIDKMIAEGEAARGSKTWSVISMV